MMVIDILVGGAVAVSVIGLLGVVVLCLSSNGGAIPSKPSIAPPPLPKTQADRGVN